MASSMIQPGLRLLQNPKIKCFPLLTAVRHTAVKPHRKDKPGTVKHRNIIASSCESLAAKGFLRSIKPYTPPANVNEKVQAICKKVLGDNFKLDSALSREDKFYLLNNCFEELKHSVPNSQLHKIVNPRDVLMFYGTPVSTTVPYDELKNQELPPNLHVQYEPVRFDPNTDSKFKGITAFPRSSTIVTGLKYKKKYKGYTTKSPFLDTEAYYDKRNKFDSK